MDVWLTSHIHVSLRYAEGAVRMGSDQGPGEPREARGGLRDGAACLRRRTARRRARPIPQLNREAVLLLWRGGWRDHDRSIHLPVGRNSHLRRWLLAQRKAHL